MKNDFYKETSKCFLVLLICGSQIGWQFVWDLPGYKIQRACVILDEFFDCLVYENSVLPDLFPAFLKIDSKLEDFSRTKKVRMKLWFKNAEKYSSPTDFLKR